MEAMSVRLSVVTSMSQIQHSGGKVSFVHITDCFTKLPMSQAIRHKKNRMILNSEREKILKETVVLQFMLLLQHFRARSEKATKN
jgi:ribosomal protein S26